MTVKFYDSVEDNLLRFAVIAAIHDGKWVFCKHRERSTFEFPGGHRESGESICDTAKRELYEETGAVEFILQPVCVYSVTGRNRVNESGEETYGMLYYADIKRFEAIPESEMENIFIFETLPKDWTYPEIQPKLLEKVQALQRGK